MEFQGIRAISRNQDDQDTATLLTFARSAGIESRHADRFGTQGFRPPRIKTPLELLRQPPPAAPCRPGPGCDQFAPDDADVLKVVPVAF